MHYYIDEQGALVFYKNYVDFYVGDEYLRECKYLGEFDNPYDVVKAINKKGEAWRFTPRYLSQKLGIPENKIELKMTGGFGSDKRIRNSVSKHYENRR